MARSPDVQDFEGWDGTPGDPYDKFEGRLWENTTRSDDRGWSLADHLRGEDEGAQGAGATGPALPPVAQATERRKALASYRRRAKESYGILVRHMPQEYKELLARV